LSVVVGLRVESDGFMADPEGGVGAGSGLAAGGVAGGVVAGACVCATADRAAALDTTAAAPMRRIRESIVMRDLRSLLLLDGQPATGGKVAQHKLPAHAVRRIDTGVCEVTRYCHVLASSRSQLWRADAL